MYTPLHVHSEYSILDSSASINALVKTTKDFGIKSLALTDSGNMFGAVEFYKKCKSENIKPIIGSELWIAYGSRTDKKKIRHAPHACPFVLLVKNLEGYKNLCKLSSIGYLEGFYYKPRIDKEVLKKYSKGLICLSGSLNGNISHLIINEKEKVEEEISWYLDVFKDDFYFEIQKHQMSDEKILEDNFEKEVWRLQKYEDYLRRQTKVNKELIEFSKKFNVKLVATNDIHYINRDDYKGHEILLNVQSGEPCEIWERDSQGNQKQRIPNPKRKVYPTNEFYYKSPDEFSKLFSDLKEAVDNTNLIAEKCNFEFDFNKKHYPVFYPPNFDKEKDADKREELTAQYLLKLCEDAIDKRYTREILDKVLEKYPDQDPKKIVKDRLKQEFEIISSKGLCDYFLIVYDFIAWAKKKKIPVGPGRGSAAGSIISYLIEITDIEPLRFNLFFERFINPERMSYPDIDVDICMERRSEVIDYTINKYGKDRVAQIITFGKMKAKMAIKDVGRVMSVPLSKVNNIAKLVPEDVNMTLDRALSIDHDLKKMYESDDEAKMIIDIAKKIEGSVRNTSIHAAGIIVSANPIMENVPVCVAKDADMVVTQFSMKPSEAVGMLKIDFLGLKTLTGIQKAVKSVKSNFNIDVPWEKLDLEDKKTFNLLNKGKTLGVFQLESSGMQDLAKQLHIDLFEEIIAVAALYRPGPMDMIPSFVNRKHKREKIENDHPLMEDVLKETYGVMVYQEQVMLIASLLAGYSLGEGDVLRRAMGKKDFEEMTAQRDKFIEGAFKKDINRELSGMIFDKIEKFASYGFNKSHAAAYAYLSYVTAFLKANYPNEWMAALMTCDRDDLTKVAKFIHECKSMKIEILPPDINIASDEFVPTEKGIRFAMSGIKGVGTGVVEEIIKERETQGKFKSLYDFIKRINMLRVGKKLIALLIDAGAFDFTTWSRDELRESIEEIYTEVQKNQKEKEKGILNFVTMMENDDEKFLAPPKVLEKSTENEMLRKEKELLGFYLTSHPMNNYKKVINKIRCVSLKELEEKDHDCFCRLAFIVDDIKTKIAAKSQKKFAILTISDGLEKFELPIWPEHFEKHQEILEENKLYFAVVQVDKKEGSMRLHLHFLEELEKVNETVLHTSEKAIEVARKQLMHIRNRKKYIASSNNSQTVLKIMLKIDVEKAKLSDILSLKYLFRQNIGKTPVDIFFYSKDKKLAKLFIDTKWGINYSENFSSKLKENQAVVAVKIKK